jgi:hypothetical protein
MPRVIDLEKSLACLVVGRRYEPGELRLSDAQRLIASVEKFRLPRKTDVKLAAVPTGDWYGLLADCQPTDFCPATLLIGHRSVDPSPGDCEGPYPLATFQELVDRVSAVPSSFWDGVAAHLPEAERAAFVAQPISIWFTCVGPLSSGAFGYGARVFVEEPSEGLRRIAPDRPVVTAQDAGAMGLDLALSNDENQERQPDGVLGDIVSVAWDGPSKYVRLDFDDASHARRVERVTVLASEPHYGRIGYFVSASYD